MKDVKKQNWSEQCTCQHDLDMKGRLCIKMIFCLKIVGLVVFDEIFHKALQKKIMKSVGICFSDCVVLKSSFSLPPLLTPSPSHGKLDERFVM